MSTIFGYCWLISIQKWSVNFTCRSSRLFFLLDEADDALQFISVGESEIELAVVRAAGYVCMANKTLLLSLPALFLASHFPVK